MMRKLASRWPMDEEQAVRRSMKSMGLMVGVLSLKSNSPCYFVLGVSEAYIGGACPPACLISV
jgi:hypothetical protein